MRKLLPLAIFLALPIGASAIEPECLVSFSGAEQNVCTGAATAATTAMQSLLSSAAVHDSSLRLIKFRGPITQAQRAAVEAAGAQIISYAPYYAYIVRMPGTLDGAARAIDGVVWAGPLLPALKIDPNIYNELKSGGVAAGLGVTELDVALDARANRAALHSAMAGIVGLSNIQVIDSAGEMRLRAVFAPTQLADTVEQLALRDDVLSVGFRKQARLNNSQGHWLHQSNINTPTPLKPIWDKGLYGCGQIVGELDTGIYMDNVAFKDASQPMPIDICTTGATCPTIATPNYAARKVIAYYKWSGLSGTGWADNHGHGTHVAGSIIGNNNVANPGTDCTNFTTPGGDTNLDGMAPGAKLVMQESGGNLAYLNTMGGTPYHAAKTAYDNGARIHSNSWGGGCTDQFGACVSGCTVTYDSESRDADRVMQDNADLLVVFAAGNDGTACPNGNNVGSPGNAKNVLTIGANGRGTGGNNMAGFSSRGPTLDARTKPDLTAQGMSIISAGRSASGTATMSGTSMATPTAAGLAALVRDYLARGFYPSGQKTASDAITSPSGALIKAILAAGAVKLTGTGAGASPGQSQGYGRIQLDQALYFDGGQRHLFIQDPANGLATSAVDDYNLTVAAGTPLSIVLNWTDVAAAVNASPATVNSLRLEVQAPNGDVWTQKLPAGFGVNNATPTQDTTSANYDNINTLQRITFATPAAGTYQVRVRGVNVPSGPQKYALAATGDLAFAVGPTHTVGGSVSGLIGSGLTLKLNGGTPLPVSGNGTFTFPGGLQSNTTYTVTVGTQPAAPAQVCTVTNGVGQIGSTDVTNVAVACTTPPTHTVGGAVSGLGGTGLSLKLNGGTPLPISTNGAFTFPEGVAEGAQYAVTFGAQPSGQSCSITNGSGTMGTANVTSVAVACTAIPTYTVGGTVSGLTGNGLTLKLNGGTPLAISTDGVFTFPDQLTGGTYAVTIGTQPGGQTCEVADGSGTIGTGNVTNVKVTCAAIPPQTYTVGGKVSGMLGTGLVLQLNGGADLPMSANGLFVFTNGLPSGAAYAVSVATQPTSPTQSCRVTNDAGTIGTANVTDVKVTCALPITDRIFEDGFDGATP